MARLRPEQTTPLRLMIGAALVIIALSMARAVLIPIALAVLLSFVLTPFQLALQRRGVGRTSAVLVVSLSAIAVLLGVLLIISFEIVDMAEELPKYQENILTKIRDIQGGNDGVFSKLSQLLGEIQQETQPKLPEGNKPLLVEMKQAPSTGLSSLVSFVAMPAVMMVASIGLVLALTISILFYREDLRNRILRLIGQGHLAFTTQAMDEAATKISSYLLIQLAINSCFGVIFTIGLFFIGVPYPMIWGMLAIVLRFIPYLGTWLAAAVPLLVSIAVHTGWTQPVLVLGLTIVLGVAVNNFLEPMWVSRSTGVSKVALVVAAAFWTWLWGPVGLILSTPLSVWLAVVGRYVPGLEFLDVLLGTRPALEIQHTYYQRLLAQDEIEATELAETYEQSHALENLCDDVLIPALGNLRIDYQKGHVDKESAEYVIETTEEIYDIISVEASESPSSMTSSEPVVIMGVAARGKIDSLALNMLDKILGQDWKVMQVPKDISEEDLKQWVEKNNPSCICLAGVAHGGQARIRSMCQRLRKRLKIKKIIVGYWGYSENAETLKERFQRHGADQVVFSLTECRNELTPLLRAASQRQELEEEES